MGGAALLFKILDLPLNVEEYFIKLMKYVYAEALIVLKMIYTHIGK